MKDIMAITLEALEVIRKEGIEWADVAAVLGREMSVDIEAGSIKSAESHTTENLTLRAFHKGGSASISLDGLDEEEIVQSARVAAEMARAAEPDPDFAALPQPEEAPEVPGLYDPAIDALSGEDCVEIAAKNIESAKKVDSNALIMGGVSIHSARAVLVNSAGVQIRQDSTSIEAAIFSIIRKGNEVGSFNEFDMGRRLEDVELDSIGAKATKAALRYLGARKVPTGKMTLILAPLASYNLFGVLLAAASAEGIQRKRSFFVEKLGKRVAAPVLTIVDDGLARAGISSSAHDGEGAVRKRVTVIEEGTLKALLHNSYTANKAKVQNTGHGGRFGGIYPTNVKVAPGEATLEELIADTREGLLLDASTLSVDVTSGDVSSSIDFAFKIENGKIAYPVANAMIGGDIFEFLEKIDAVSRDYREEPGNIIPSVRIRDIQVSGGG